MATEYKGLTIKFGADTKAMNSALSEAKSIARGTQTELKLLNQGLKFDPSNVTLLAQKQEVLKKKIQATKQELQAYKTLEADANSGKVNLTDSQWTKLQSDITIATAKLKAYEEELTQIQVQQASANSKLGQAGAKMTELGEKSEGVSQKLSNVGSTLTRTVTLGLVAAGTASVAAATKIDTSLTNVKKTVDGTAEDYQKLKDAAIEFSKTNAVSASQILDVESLGAQLGYTLDIMSNGKSEVQEFGEVVSGLDIATNMDAETAGSELAQFFNIMQLGKEQTENYASAIVDLGNKNATTESSISSMALRIAGAGKQLNMSGADVLGLATAMSSLGIEAEMGGTAISTIMSSIDKSVALSDDNLKTWADTAGMTTEQFQASWKNNVAETLITVLKSMDEAVEGGGNMSVMLDELGISSLRQTDVMKRLAGSGDVLSNAISTANTAWSENIALDNEVANRNDSLAAKFEMLKNRVIAVAEQIGRPLADALLEAIDAASPLFTAIENGAKAFSELSTEEQRTILGFAGMAAALGPVLKIMGNTSNAFKSVGSMLTKVSKGMAELNIEALKQAGTWNSMSTSMQTATTAQKAHTVATKAGTVATKALGVAMKATLAGFAVAVVLKLVEGIQKLADAQQKAIDRANNLKNVEDNLLTSTQAVKTASEEASTGIETQSKSFQDIRDEIDETIQKQSDFATSQKETWGEINANSQYVSQLVDDITKLADKENLTADEQAKLSSKVAEYNNLTGDTVEIVDAVRGKLSVSTDELKKNSDAWIRNAEAQAYQERYTEAFKNRIDAVKNLEDAERKLAEAQETLDSWNNSDHPFDPFTNGALEQSVKDAQKAVDDAQTTVDDYDDVLSDAAQKQAELTQQTFYSSDAFKNIAEKYGIATNELQDLCEQYGITGEEATAKFAEGLASGAEAVKAAGATLSGLSLNEFEDKLKEYDIAGEENIKAFAQGMAGGREACVSAGALIAGLTADEFEKKTTTYNIQGKDATLQFAEGIKSGEQETVVAGALIAGVPINEFKAKMDEYRVTANDDVVAFAQGLTGNQEAVQQAAAGVAGVSVKEFQDKLNDYNITAQEDVYAFAQAMRNGQGDVIGAASQTAGMGVAQFQALCSQYGIEGESDINKFAQALRDNGWNAEQAASQVANSAKDNMNADTESKGRDFLSGFLRGLWNGSLLGQICRAAANVADMAGSALAAAQDSHSPSKMTKALGQDFGDGYILGIEDKQKEAVKASKNLAQTTMKALDTSMSSKAVRSIAQSNVTLPQTVINATGSSKELTRWLDTNLGTIINQNAPATVIDNDAGSLIVDNRLQQLQRKAGMNRGYYTGVLSTTGV